MNGLHPSTNYKIWKRGTSSISWRLLVDRPGHDKDSSSGGLREESWQCLSISQFKMQIFTRALQLCFVEVTHKLVNGKINNDQKALKHKEQPLIMVRDH